MVSFLGCKSDDIDKFYVVSTTGMVHDIVLNVAGDLVKSNALMGPGVDPHLYKASVRDIKKLSKADLIFYNGLHLEANMIDCLNNLEIKRQLFRYQKEFLKRNYFNLKIMKVFLIHIFGLMYLYGLPQLKLLKIH